MPEFVPELTALIVASVPELLVALTPWPPPPAASIATGPLAERPTADPEAARPVRPLALTPVPLPPEALTPMPLSLVAYTPQPEPACEAQTPIPSPPVPLFWPRTAEENPPGEVLEMTPMMAVASPAVLLLVPETAVPAVLLPLTPAALAPKAKPSTPAPEPATSLLL